MNTKKFMGDYLLAGMYGETRTLSEMPYNELSTLPKGHGRKNMLRLLRIEALLTKKDPKSIQDCCEFITIINKKVNYLSLASPKYPRRIEQLISFGIFPTIVHAIMGLYKYKLPTPTLYKKGEMLPVGVVFSTPQDAFELEDYVNDIIDTNLGPYIIQDIWSRFIRHYPLIKYMRNNKDLFGKGKAEGCFLTEPEIKLYETVGAGIDVCCHILRSLSYFRPCDGYALTQDRVFMNFMFEMLMDDRYFSCAVYALEEIICCANEFTAFNINEVLGKRFLEIVNSFGPYKFAAFSRVLIQLTYDNEVFKEHKKKGLEIFDRKKRDRNYRPIDVNHAIVMSIKDLFKKINKLLLSCKCIHGKKLDIYFRRETDIDKSVQVIIYETMRKDWDKLGEADTMLPESVVFHGDEPALGKADLFIPTFMVELIYTLNTLIRGKRRLEVQQLFMSTEGSLTILNRIIDAAVWLESDPNYNTNQNIKAHVLRFINNLADKFSKQKLLFFSEHEAASIKALKFEENIFLKEHSQDQEDGIVGKLCRILVKINPDSNFSYWIVNMLSSLTRNLDTRYAYWFLEGGVLNHILGSLITNISPSTAQTYFDFLGDAVFLKLCTLLKLKDVLEKSDEETISKFLQVMEKNIEDSCVFIRKVILTLYNFPEEHTGRLKTLVDFYQEHKIRLAKLMVENLKVSKMCDENICLLNASLMVFFYEEKYGNLESFVKTIAESESKEVISDYIETLKFWQKFYLNFGMDILTFHNAYNVHISVFDELRIKLIGILRDFIK